MSKPIKLDCRLDTFITKGEAENYYLNKREYILNLPNSSLTSGQLFLEFKEIYEKYCKYTNWSMPGKVVGFSVGNTTRENDNRHSTTKCFSTHFDKGEEQEFSIKKALTSIANYN